LNSSALGIGILDVRSLILGGNGCNAIGFTSALEGRQRYMEDLQMVCKKKLSTMVLLAEQKKTGLALKRPVVTSKAWMAKKALKTPDNNS
jgi:hypothetical protein